MTQVKRKKAPPSPSPATDSKPVKQPKAAAKPVAEVRDETTPTADSLFHGVEIVGNRKKGGTARHPITAILTLDQIQVVKGFNPRSDVGDIESLAKSIKADGLLSSLVVRPSAKEGKFDLIAGERRYRALQSLGWADGVPVLIRSDLLGEDERALAVAVAENSEDGRSNLNPIEIGRVVQKLRDEHGWEPLRIAKECGMHPQKVRRALALMGTPESVRVRIEDGTISANAGLEIARLDKTAQTDVVKVIVEEGGASSAADIRRIRKQIATQQNVEETALKGPKTTKKGTAPKRAPTAWRGSREKQETLQRICAHLAGMEKDESNGLFIEQRAFAVVLLWDRGDLQSLDIPDLDSTAPAAKKANKVLWAAINAEAAKAPVTESTAPDEEVEVESDDDGEQG